eukprot:4277826-Amphidinium_carterae.2
MDLCFLNSFPNGMAIYGDDASPIPLADVSQGSGDPRVLIQMVPKNMIEKLQDAIGSSKCARRHSTIKLAEQAVVSSATCR